MRRGGISNPCRRQIERELVQISRRFQGSAVVLFNVFVLFLVLCVYFEGIFRTMGTVSRQEIGSFLSKTSQFSCDGCKTPSLSTCRRVRPSWHSSSSPEGFSTRKACLICCTPRGEEKTRRAAERGTSRTISAISEHRHGNGLTRMLESVLV